MNDQQSRADELARKVFDGLVKLSPVLRRDFIITGASAAWIYDGLFPSKEINITLTKTPFDLLVKNMHYSDEARELLSSVTVNGIKIRRMTKVTASVSIGNVKVSPIKEMCNHTFFKDRYRNIVERGYSNP